MLTATSTEFLLISEKINYLQESFDWIVGGIGVVITIVLVIIGFSQFFYGRKLIREELNKLKKEVDTLMDKTKTEINNTTLDTLDEKALSLQSLIEENISSVRTDMQSQKESMEADIDRSYALSCGSDHLYALALEWWLSAATHYDYIKDENLFTVSIKEAKDSLENIQSGDGANIRKLWEKMTRCQNYLSKLSKDHPAETKIISDLMNAKAALPETATIAKPLKV